MALGFPAIPPVNKLDLRSIATSMSNARQRIEALEKGLNDAIGAASVAGPTPAQFNTLANLVAQLNLQLSAIAAAVNGQGFAGHQVVFIQGEDGEDGIGFPGPAGAAGVAGAQGQVIFLPGEDGEDGIGFPGVAGAAGATGGTGATGPAIFLVGEDGEEGTPGIPGATGATGAAGSPLSINTQTASYTLVSNDGNNVQVDMNVATANNLTVPPHSSVAFAVGTAILVCQYGAGQTTIVAGSGVTLRTPSSLTTRARYSTVGLVQIATDEWVVSGDLT